MMDGDDSDQINFLCTVPCQFSGETQISKLQICRFTSQISCTVIQPLLQSCSSIQFLLCQHICSAYNLMLVGIGQCSVSIVDLVQTTIQLFVVQFSLIYTFSSIVHCNILIKTISQLTNFLTYSFSVGSNGKANHIINVVQFKCRIYTGRKVAD